MKGFAFILAATLLWAIDTLFRYPLLGKGIPVLQIVFFEHILLCLFFIPLLPKFIKKIWSLSIAEIFYFFIIGFVASGLGTLSFTKAMGLINPSIVIILQKMQPIIAIILAKFVLGESIDRRYIKWAVLCLVGGLLISSNDLLAFITHLQASDDLFELKAFKGYLFALGAAVCWGGATVFGKKLAGLNFDVSELMIGRFYAALLGLLPLCLSTLSTVQASVVMQEAKSFFLMVSLSGILGMWFYYKGLKLLKAKVATLAEMFFPFFAIILNWIFLGAGLNLVQITGALVLLLASFMIQFKRY